MAKPKKKPTADNDSLKEELHRLRRELEVEASLEKVRNRATAMRTSAEQAETSAVMFHEIQELGINVIRSGVAIIDEAHEAIELWLTTISEKREVVQILDYVNIHVHPVYENILPARKKKNPYALTVLTGAEVKDYYQRMSTYITLPKQKTFNGKEHFYSFFFGEGSINVIVIEPLTKEECSIMSRFANAFGLIYTRFIDLQKAEKQAQEARIEASLERVRSRSMAMRKSEELGEAAVMLYQELRTLGVTNFFNCGYMVVDVEHNIQHGWMTGKEGKSMQGFKLPITGDKVLQARYEAWQRQDPVYYESVGGDELWKHIAFVSPHFGSKEVDKMVKSNFSDPTVFYSFNFTNGYLHIISNALLNVEDEELTIRFARVFELTYRRFLDLQKAEAQTREAEIELGLERVRARAMAMRHSDELAELVATVFRELNQLEFSLASCIIWIHNPGDKSNALWIASDKMDKPAKPLEITPFYPPFFESIIAAWKAQDPKWIFPLSGTEKKKFEKLFFKEYPELPEALKKSVREHKQIVYSASFNRFGALEVVATEPLTDEKFEVLHRFGKVFDSSYTRFNDLKKAEAQAREAQIEVSVERVRSKAMAMRLSQDLLGAAEAMRNEMLTLKVDGFTGSSIYLVDKNNWISMWDFSDPGNRGQPGRLVARWDPREYPILGEIWKIWQQGKYAVVEYGSVRLKQALEEWRKVDIAVYSVLKEAMDGGQLHTQWNSFGCFSEGVIGFDLMKPPTEDTKVIVTKLTAAFDLAYQRYEDLKEAEARAQLAIREASLDRVRAEIASMRHADDLQRITPLMWRELKTLGVPFFRCGVLIVNEQDQKADYYLSTPEGRPLAALHLDFNTEFQAVQNALEHWRQQKVYIDHWSKEQFVAFGRSMMELGQIQTMQSYQGGEQPPESITLQFVPFTQGMLYVGSSEALSSDQLQLMKVLADAFSTAYARYEDFTRLEAAKATVEKTLSELRTTQTQLVQSEKMASLGELTAGIAHEIQNPLNFVNNFSEVSKELLDEMKAELASGNLQPATELAESVIQNLEKINFHGKRADGIVKSMLQHSRKSTGQKEPTDINALCDEYLRLSYHGLRAKDKSFNAKFETDLEPSVGSLNVLPQEIGRVVLNLINNAFYAVSEMKKLNLDNYEPTVTVTTRKTEKNIEVRVRDNGIGIPQKVLDKIFNPFFTTKPTGQGTGLGLSLSYDIITKGHGGEVKVVTKEGEGSEFTVMLPAL